MSDHTEHFFALWPPITASSIKITINGWSGQPCMSLLMVGCSNSVGMYVCDNVLFCSTCCNYHNRYNVTIRRDSPIPTCSNYMATS